MVNLNESAESITSQNGENGIIEAIYDEIGTANKVCVEFGAYHLKELSNVYPLWNSDGWNSILIEGNEERYQQLQHDYSDHFGHTGEVELIQSMVNTTGHNRLDAILERQDVPHDFDLLSIDVDGMDYHIWKEVKEFSPRVVVIEFNPTILPWKRVIGGAEGNYVGASLQAILELGNSKGYDLVTTTVNNAIFVKKEESKPFPDTNDINAALEPHFKETLNIIRVLGRTYDGELFFSGPPTHSRSFTFANEHSESFEEPEDIYYEKGSPSPSSPISYFITYPIGWILSRQDFFSVKSVLEWSGLMRVVGPIYDRLRSKL